MSHCFGVRCVICHDTLESDDRCPEGCKVGHGYTYQVSCDWAAKTWPDHICFEEYR